MHSSEMVGNDADSYKNTAYDCYIFFANCARLYLNQKFENYPIGKKF